MASSPPPATIHLSARDHSALEGQQPGDLVVIHPASVQPVPDAHHRACGSLWTQACDDGNFPAPRAEEARSAAERRLVAVDQPAGDPCRGDGH